MPVLKYLSGGSYVPLPGGLEEVTISPNQPPVNTDLWINPSDSSTGTRYYDLGSGTYKPIPGSMSQAAADARYAQKNIFATTAARDAAIPSPATGQKCFITATLESQTYISGLGWVSSGYTQRRNCLNTTISPGAATVLNFNQLGTQPGGTTAMAVQGADAIVVPFTGMALCTIELHATNNNASQVAVTLKVVGGVVANAPQGQWVIPANTILYISYTQFVPVTNAVTLWTNVQPYVGAIALAATSSFTVAAIPT